jgi:hypothetical protein
MRWWNKHVDKNQVVDGSTHAPSLTEHSRRTLSLMVHQRLGGTVVGSFHITVEAGSTHSSDSVVYKFKILQMPAN